MADVDYTGNAKVRTDDFRRNLKIERFLSPHDTMAGIIP